MQNIPFLLYVDSYEYIIKDFDQHMMFIFLGNIYMTHIMLLATTM